MQILVKKVTPMIEDVITGETTALTDVLSQEDRAFIEKLELISCLKARN